MSNIIEIHGSLPAKKRAYENSLRVSQERRQEKEKRQLEKFLRRRHFLGAAAATLALATGSAAAINALTPSDRGGIDHRITVKFGDTLSGIAEDTLQEHGNPDPSTQEINAEVDEIVEANAGHISGETVQAGVELDIPK